MASQKDAREGGETRGNFLEAGAHLWLAEELRLCAGLLTGGTAHPRVAVKRLDDLAQALQAEGAAQRWESGGGAYGGSVAQASRAASCVHRASQLRHAASAVLEYAHALRHGSARGGVSVFGGGGIDACDPTVVPTLLSLADSETALARAKARPQSRPGASDHAHAPLPSRDGLLMLYSGLGISAKATVSSQQRPVASRAAMHVRRRLLAAGEDLEREASLVADAAPLLPPPPPDAVHVAASVLAGGGRAVARPFKWREAGHGRREDGGGLGKGYVHAALWGSTIHPQHGGVWLGGGFRWRGGADGYGSDGSSSDLDSDDQELERRAAIGRRAVRHSERLSNRWEPDNGTCVRCVEREVKQRPTLLAR